jgi:hypothetical protein
MPRLLLTVLADGLVLLLAAPAAANGPERNTSSVLFSFVEEDCGSRFR